MEARRRIAKAPQRSPSAANITHTVDPIFFNDFLNLSTPVGPSALPIRCAHCSLLGAYHTVTITGVSQLWSSTIRQPTIENVSWKLLIMHQHTPTVKFHWKERRSKIKKKKNTLSEIPFAARIRHTRATTTTTHKRDTLLYYILNQNKWIARAKNVAHGFLKPSVCTLPAKERGIYGTESWRPKIDTIFFFCRNKYTQQQHKVSIRWLRYRFCRSGTMTIIAGLFTFSLQFSFQCAVTEKEK